MKLRRWMYWVLGFVVAIGCLWIPARSGANPAMNPSQTAQSCLVEFEKWQTRSGPRAKEILTICREQLKSAPASFEKAEVSRLLGNLLREQGKLAPAETFPNESEAPAETFLNESARIAEAANSSLAIGRVNYSLAQLKIDRLTQDLKVIGQFKPGKVVNLQDFLPQQKTNLETLQKAIAQFENAVQQLDPADVPQAKLYQARTLTLNLAKASQALTILTPDQRSTLSPKNQKIFTEIRKITIQLTETWVQLMETLPSQIATLPNTSAGIASRIYWGRTLASVDSVQQTNHAFNMAYEFSPIQPAPSSPSKPAPSKFPTSWKLPQTLEMRLSAIAQTGPQQAQEQLKLALQQAEATPETRVLAGSAIDSLTEIYEANNQWAEINTVLTESRILSIDATGSPEIAAQLYARYARLLADRQGNLDNAIAISDIAIERVEVARRDLLFLAEDVQYNYRDRVDRLYRENIRYHLSKTSTPDQKTLTLVRNRIEALRLADIHNYFSEPCVEGQSVKIDELVDKQATPTAMVYPIVLSDRVVVITKLPGQDLLIHSTQVSPGQVNDTLARFLTAVKRESSDPEIIQSLGQEIYQWLLGNQAITQFIQESSEANVRTLVFVPDEAFRGIPLSALSPDGQSYLIEKVAIAVSPGSQLFDPKPFDPKSIKLLAAGITTVPYEQLDPVESAEPELTFLQSNRFTEVVLQDDQANSEKIRQVLKTTSLNAWHFATHGKFGAKEDDTFIVLHDKRVLAKEFGDWVKTTSRLREEPLEMIFFSACETAQGDNRAALGLAGLAIRANARSAIGGLWEIKMDIAPEVVETFYTELLNGNNKAQALRLAQLHQKGKEQPPARWSVFTLVGNWL